ncbi:exported hypothetical protein [Nostocoides japonicum T1-X7]|uniref:Uncharacterized protein n=1 Tax=Nostocoides japonicum T1-X7 TaxID=1194083 RepID=A0A077M255_9MICO|nr:hypothetical protein [Tetrasphaera japonica]CCH80433.1 exported hypothetical protein [Tetrasphaera japonica T1-X7]
MEGRLPIIGRPRRRRVVVLVATAAFTPAAVGQVAAAPTAQAVAHGSAGAHHETAPDGPAYRMTDVGTFGGPSADVVGPTRQMTPRGAVIGIADTTRPDADSPNTGLAGDDPYLFHAFAWYHGRLHDLGALPGENSSVVQEVNGHGLGVGGSETGAYDPRAHAPAMHTVLFRSGKVIDLGTLPGGSESFAVSVTEEGVVAGVSNSAAAGPGMPDFFDWGGQIRSFVWKDGRMRDLGTLGGPGTVLVRVNEHGVVAGDSYVGSAVDPDTGYPTLHPFLWRDGRMRDLGGFGGGRSVTRWLNERGQVTGYATLPGDDAAHPFLWDGRRLRDLGTLGGSYASGEHVDDRGDVARVLDDERPGAGDPHVPVARGSDERPEPRSVLLPRVDQQPRAGRRRLVRRRCPAVAERPTVRPQRPRRPDLGPAHLGDLRERARRHRRRRRGTERRPARLPPPADGAPSRAPCGGNVRPLGLGDRPAAAAAGAGRPRAPAVARAPALRRTPRPLTPQPHRKEDPVSSTRQTRIPGRRRIAASSLLLRPIDRGQTPEGHR